jgi:hypothetical protein
VFSLVESFKECSEGGDDFVFTGSTMILRAHVLKKFQLDDFEAFDDGVSFT